MRPCDNCPNLGQPHRGACKKYMEWFTKSLHYAASQRCPDKADVTFSFGASIFSETGKEYTILARELIDDSIILAVRDDYTEYVHLAVVDPEDRDKQTVLLPGDVEDTIYDDRVGS